MTKNIDDLRSRLFDTIDGLRGGTVTVDQAKAISELSQVIVNSAKVEVEYARQVEGAQSKFLPAPAKPDPADSATWPRGITGVRQHRIEG